MNRHHMVYQVCYHLECFFKNNAIVVMFVEKHLNQQNIDEPQNEQNIRKKFCPKFLKSPIFALERVLRVEFCLIFQGFFVNGVSRQNHSGFVVQELVIGSSEQDESLVQMFRCESGSSKNKQFEAKCGNCILCLFVKQI